MAKKDSIPSQIPAQVQAMAGSQELHNQEQEGFEVLLQKAKEVLGKLNSQEVSLQESLTLYKQGMQNLKNAQEILESAKLQYQEIKD